MKQVPPIPDMTGTLLSTIISSAVSLIVGLIGGGLAGYNGWKSNRINEGQKAIQADIARTNAEATLNQTSSALINDALQLVKSLRDEIERLRIENEELRKKFEDLQARLDTLESENRQLLTSLRTQQGPRRKRNTVANTPTNASN